MPSSSLTNYGCSEASPKYWSLNIFQILAPSNPKPSGPAPHLSSSKSHSNCLLCNCGLLSDLRTKTNTLSHPLLKRQ